ncbi:hypothetical protein K788_00002070 [Paraburkholderia caribensis MBA4]|uniref:Uncharacterized protein n=1 Tax=Paraburkholderia caribensis MBA4 TaxID=1323664 RepID=A0A0P0RII1_9BURK|nr:hypothetical protein K788_00002070 [Paraburkholderia caribensis MBA4]
MTSNITDLSISGRIETLDSGFQAEHPQRVSDYINFGQHAFKRTVRELLWIDLSFRLPDRVHSGAKGNSFEMLRFSRHSLIQLRLSLTY